MHRIWEVPELRKCIFEHLALKDYAAVVLVCKAFFASAVPFLWHTVIFEDAAALLGHSLTFLDPQHSVPMWTKVCKTCISLTKPLDETDLERFRFYASHIRKLDVQMPTECQNFSKLLQQLLPLQPLWPALNELILSFPTSAVGDGLLGQNLLQVFFVAPLKSVSLAFMAFFFGFPEALNDIRKSVIDHIEALESLTLYMHISAELSPADVDTIAQVLTAHPLTLRTLRLKMIPPIPLKLAQTIASLKHLELLNLGSLPEASEDSYTSEGSRLTRLTANGSPLAINQFLKSATSAPLHSLDVVVKDVAASKVLNVPSLMSTVNRLDSVQVLMLRINLEPSDFREEPCLFTELPLHTFYRVKRFWLHVPYSWDSLTAVELKAIAQNVPQLTHLSICESNRDPLLELPDLQPLGEFCPRLESLHIGVRGQSGDLAQLTHPMSSVTMVVFHHRTWLCEPEEKLAEYIRHLWPNLQLGCAAPQWKFNMRASRWKPVWDLVGANDSTMPVWQPKNGDDWMDPLQYLVDLKECQDDLDRDVDRNARRDIRRQYGLSDNGNAGEGVKGTRSTANSAYWFLRLRPLVPFQVRSSHYNYTSRIHICRY